MFHKKRKLIPVRADWRTQLTVNGLLGLVLALWVACLPVKVPPTQLIRSYTTTARSAAPGFAVWAQLTLPEGMPETYAIYIPAVSSRREWVNEEGRVCVQSPWYDSPSVDLPRSPFAIATHSILTDDVKWQMAPKPTLAVFAWGTLVPVATGTYTAFQNALNAAGAWDTIEIQTPINGSAPNTIALPNRGDSAYVLIRDADTWGNLPAEGTRVNRTTHWTTKNAITHTTGSGGSTGLLLNNANSSRGWYFRGIYSESNHTLSTTDCSGLWLFGCVNPNYNNLTNNIVISQCWAHNDWTTTNTKRCRRAWEFSGTHTVWVEDSQISGMIGNGTESQAMNVDRGEGFYIFRNNELEGCSETILTGGTAKNYTNSPYVGQNHDMLITRNRLYRRDAWMVPGGFWFTNHKNFKEHKDARRTVWEKNVCVNFAGTGQQHCFNFKHAPQSAAEAGVNGLVSTHDVWCRLFKVENGAAPVNITCGTGSFRSNPGTYRIEVSQGLWVRTYSGFADSGNRILHSDLQTGVNLLTDVRLKNLTCAPKNTAIAISNPTGNPTGNTNTMAGYRVLDVVFYASPQYPTPNASGGTGATILNQACGPGLWQFAGCVMRVGATRTLSYHLPGLTTNNYGTSPNVDIQFQDTASDDYTLVDAAFQTVSTKGGRPGVDFAHLTNKISGV